MLPEATWMIGCQPEEMNELGEGVSTRVKEAVGLAIDELRRLVAGMGVAWLLDGAESQAFTPV